MSTSKKRKFVDLTSDSPLPTQPTKKFKACVSPKPDSEGIEVITEDYATSADQLPALEKDENHDRCKDNKTHNEPNNEHTFELNERVQVHRDEILHSAQILEIQQNSTNSLYLLHYDQLSSVYDEWVPSHKITPIPRDTSPPPSQEDSPSPPSSPIYNQKLLTIIPEPAKAFPFELDTFQFDAIQCIETENVNLLITAHTSAGKTVVAEYAIAKALQKNQRVIYTSPIKALSNQKYREFTEKFGHTNIGLITGDVTKRKGASILVMTTEILRNMLYKGGSELREVAFVIFDEVHYMRDVERGVVWEESIILLNKKITLIFLSATLSNSDDFALWVTDLKGKECKVIGTEQRPTVLEHFVLPQGSDALYLVASSASKGTFIDANFESAQGAKAVAKTYKQMDQERKRRKLKITGLQLLLFMLHKKDWCPAIVFAFSKREVEGHALALNDAINFCTKEESDMIEDVFNNAIDSLSDKDKQLPAVRSLLPLLKKGIGVHHGGILPILKEVTEILFQEGMIKVLFATETFAMGVNMPAKCVVFSAIEKYDGQQTRVLLSSEYIQMSGRAGRRGIDDKGIVIMMLNDSITKKQCKELMCGTAGALTSSFRLTYNMLLNISKNIRTNVSGSGDITDVMEHCEDGDGEGFSYHSVIEKSFYRFLMTQRIPQIEQRMKQLRVLLNDFEGKDDFEDMKIYFDLYDLKQKILNKAHKMMTAGYIMNKYLDYGRIVFVEVDQGDADTDEDSVKDTVIWGWGVVLGYCKRHQPDSYFADILIPSQIVYSSTELCIPQAITDSGIDLMKVIDFKSLTDEQKKKNGLLIVRFSTTCIKKISSVRISDKKLPSRLMDDRDFFDVYNELHHVYNFEHFKHTIPVLDMFEDMNVLTYYKESNKIALKEEFEERLPKLKERMNETAYFKKKLKEKEHAREREHALYLLYREYKKSKKEFNMLSSKISTYNVGQFAKELKCKCRVLKRLEYLNDESILTSKGIAASCLEINHEILITELIFDNFFDKLKAEEICAVLSVFVMDRPNKSTGNENQNRNKVEFAVPLIVHESYQKILIKAREILCIKKECGLTDEFGLFDNVGCRNEEDYLACFNPGLMTAIFQWVNGADFVVVNKLTPMFEGALIRLIKRLRDIVNQLVDAAKAIGNEQLAKTFGDCIDKLQHGIVFAASLYVDDLDEDEEDEEEEGDEDNDEQDETEMTQSEDEQAQEETKNEGNHHSEMTHSEDEQANQVIDDIFGNDQS
eukprot:639098_1